MQKIIYSGHVLVFQDDKVLLVRHGEKAGHLTGVYGIPGGRPDEGESIIDSAARELEEESGLKVTVRNLNGFPNNKYTADIKRKDGTKRMTMTVYTCTKFGGDPKDSLESKPEWIKIPDLDKYNLLPNVKKSVEDALKFLKNE